MSMSRVYGVLLLIGSAALAAVVLGFPPREPAFLQGLAAMAPLLAVVGVAVLLLPSPYRERVERGEDVWELSGLRMVTPRWWGVLFVGVAAAAGGYLLPTVSDRLPDPRGIQAAHRDAPKPK